ncbi:MAG TPA: hypothetical protein VLH09_05375, partial [Bryobacteraceae bacterium]|nr:hypothetical protein [Bryobacteraceae bacterium]
MLSKEVAVAFAVFCCSEAPNLPMSGKYLLRTIRQGKKPSREFIGGEPHSVFLLRSLINTVSVLSEADADQLANFIADEVISEAMIEAYHAKALSLTASDPRADYTAIAVAARDEGAEGTRQKFSEW